MSFDRLSATVRLTDGLGAAERARNRQALHLRRAKMNDQSATQPVTTTLQIRIDKCTSLADYQSREPDKMAHHLS